MKINTLFILLLTAVCCQAQTKPIAHKSHSGSKHSFSKAYQTNLFDLSHSNFGGPTSRSIILLDTIIAIDDTTAVIKYRESNVCYPFGTTYKDLNDADYKHRTDTLNNCELFYNTEKLTLIKSLRMQHKLMPFQNPIKEIVLIGFKRKRKFK